MTTRERVLELIERMPDDDLEAFVPLLERMAPKRLDDLQARWDAMPPEEDVDEETLAQIRAAQARIAAGDPVTTLDDIRARSASLARLKGAA